MPSYPKSSRARIREVTGQLVTPAKRAAMPPAAQRAGEAPKSLPTAEPKAAGLTYSGGVASCYYNGEPGNVFEYGDVGVLLARAVKNNAALKTITTYPAAETIRATVVGAGTHTTNVSGSTISYTNGKLPIKNIPVLKISEEEEQEPAMFRDAIRRKLKLYEGENGLEQVAIVFSGKYHTTFAQLQELSRTIAEGADEVIAGPHPLILVIENDIAKALGNALNVLLMRKKDIIRLCEDHPDCVFSTFTNGTLIDEAFADEMLRVKNFVPAISIEGFEEATDSRRGNGTYQKIIRAMNILKEKKLPFGISCCYTSANAEVAHWPW